MIRILLADDHPIISEGISNLLESEQDLLIVGACKNGLEVLSELKKQEVDLILMDVEMPEMNGFQCAEAVLKANPEQKIAMLTMHQEKALIQKFISMGIKGYFLKTIEKDELILGIQMIAKGGAYFPAEVTRTLVEDKPLSPKPSSDPRLAELSSREKEIKVLIALSF